MKKLLTILFISIFLISFTSAYLGNGNSKEFIKNSGDKYGSISIIERNMLSPDKKLIEYKLIDNTDFCFTNCYAEGTATLYESGKLFTDIQYKDLKNNNFELINNKIYLLEIENYEIEINDYKEICKYEFNKTLEKDIEVCTSEKSGSHKESRQKYKKIEYNGENLNAGLYRWRIEGIKDINDDIDWIATSGLGNQRMTEWALWNSSFNIGLTDYYTYDSNKEIIYGINNFTNFAGTVVYNSSSCLIGNCSQIRPSNTLRLNRNDDMDMLSNNSIFPNVTLNFWFRTANGATTKPQVFSRYDGTNIRGFLSVGDNVNQIFYFDTFWNGSIYKSPENEANNVWIMITWKRNESNSYIYINGTLKATGQDIFNTAGGNYSWILGGHPTAGSSYDMNGQFDEMGLWNRSLSDAEIKNLYNNGNGLTYNNVGIVLPIFTENYQNYNNNTYIYLSENYSLSINYNSSLWSNISAKLNFNGTNYTATKEGTGDDLFFNYTNLLMNGLGQKNITWLITLTNITGDFVYNTSTKTQNVKDFIFSICNSTINVSYLNISFKDESTLLNINASIPTSTFTYWFDIPSHNKTLNFINNTDNYEYDFCFTPSDRNINLISTISYKQGTYYPQRIYSQDSIIYNNITTNKTLYLLSSIDGIFVTFQTINSARQIVGGVLINGTENIAGTDIVVANGITDAAGVVTFWLNPNFAHTFTFSKTGYETLIETIIPTQSAYTVTLIQQTSISPDNRQGIGESVEPFEDFLLNDTIYNFNYTTTSSLGNIQTFGFNLFYDNGSLINSQTSSNNNGGFLGVNANTLNATSIYMTYFYQVNNSYVNGTKYWIIQNNGNQFSIFHLFSDLSLYMNAGMFGLTSFGRVLISFLIMVMIVIGVTYRYGVANEASVMGFLFGAILFLDQVGFMPITTIGGLTPQNHLITIITGIIFAGMLIKQEMY